jgi:predicted transposase YdaD
MTAQEKIDYEAHIKDRTISRSMLETAKLEGKLEGKIEGKLEGKIEGKMEGQIEGALLKGKFAAQKLIQRGFDNEEIADITGLTIVEIEAIRQEMN